MTRVFIRVIFVVSTLGALGCGSTVVMPPPVDGGVVCRFSDGTECRPGQSCPSPDGCNACACSADGTLACTARACVDAGPPDAPSPRACQSTADCERGDECHITEGCATPSYCGPMLGRPCTGDVVPYCGCDGATFFASSTCPTRTYERRGRCESADAGTPACVFPDGRVCLPGQRCPAPDGCNTCTCTPEGLACTEIACVDGGPPRDGGLVCAALDARGEGDCDGYFGVAWNGSTCASITGCRCVGADCGRVFRSREECAAACGG
ncbi:MAG: hypothetical protein Q8S73_09640 [Deltaproteobacteria bacterium]|nr:hypothetical protein [Myxococcales bacterium]MDP3214355.1 hypothetical protein [Deltaproteobacteria bacterium]